MEIRVIDGISCYRVIRNPSDASKDYWMPCTEARKLYREGKLKIDLTNNAYTEFVPQF